MEGRFLVNNIINDLIIHWFDLQTCANGLDYLDGWVNLKAHNHPLVSPKIFTRGSAGSPAFRECSGLSKPVFDY